MELEIILTLVHGFFLGLGIVSAGIILGIILYSMVFPQ